MGDLKHTRPCAGCPWRRESAAGWLGDSTPEEFLATTKAEVPMPCHCAVDYSEPGWKERAEAAPLCAGALIFLRNSMQLPRDADHAAAALAVEKDPVTVFQWGPEFLAHHNSGITVANYGRGERCANCTQAATTEHPDGGDPLCAKCADQYCFGCKTVDHSCGECGGPGCGCQPCFCEAAAII